MKNKELFQNKSFQTSSQPSSFNLVSQVSTFNSLFDVKPLDEKEANKIDLIMIDGFLPGELSEEEVGADMATIKQLTSEIKSIGRQGALLMGERVFRARELLKLYKDGTFTKWLEAAFGSKRSGYNLLTYYELFKALPHEELKNKFKQLPQKTAYMLSSRQGDIEAKSQIISEYYDRSHDEIAILIQEKFPTNEKDKRSAKSLIDRLLTQLESTVENLFHRKDELNEENHLELSKLQEKLASITSDVSPEEVIAS